MSASSHATQALDQVRSLLDEAEAADALGRRLPERSWTPENQRTFLQSVADGKTVEVSAAALGLSAQSAYAFRRTARGAAFALGWRAAALIARQAIADQLLERALTGQTETLTRADGTQVSRLRFDNRLAMSLLARLDRQAEQATDADATSARLVASEFDAFLDLVGKDGGPAHAGLFLARRSPILPEGEQRDLQPVLALAAADRFARVGAATAEEVDIADLAPIDRASWTAEQWTRAEAAGLVVLAPADTNDADDADHASTPQPPQLVAEYEPVWQDVALGWVTNAPPPEDFDGNEVGDYDDDDYRRTLTAAELEVWLAPLGGTSEARRAEDAAWWQDYLAERARSAVPAHAPGEIGAGSRAPDDVPPPEGRARA